MTEDRNQFSKFLLNFISGGISAAMSKTVTAPIDRTQAASSHIKAGKHYVGIIDAFARIPNEQGFISFWRGNWANVLRYFPLQALNFAFKDFYREVFFFRKSNDRYIELFAKNLLSGGVAGVTSLCFVYPLDFTRTRLAADVGCGNSREFNGLLDCLCKNFRVDGVRGLYRGFFVSVQCIFVYRAFYFGIFDTVKTITSNEDRKLNLFHTWILAQFVTTISGLMAYPWDTVRRRMMMQSGRIDMLYKSSWHCLQKMIKSEGFFSLYNGALLNVLRSIGGALVLTLYDHIQTLSS